MWYIIFCTQWEEYLVVSNVQRWSTDRIIAGPFDTEQEASDKLEELGCYYPA